MTTSFGVDSAFVRLNTDKEIQEIEFLTSHYDHIDEEHINFFGEKKLEFDNRPEPAVLEPEIHTVLINGTIVYTTDSNLWDRVFGEEFLPTEEEKNFNFKFKQKPKRRVPLSRRRS